MSAEHPIFAITGSSGAGSSALSRALNHLLWREQISAVYIQGNAFHRFEREEMRQEVIKYNQQGKILSHYGPDANMFDKLETLFFQYSATGTGKRRYYLHTEDQAARFNCEPGTFTPWEDIEKGSDMLIYRGLHGGVIDKENDINIAQYADLLIGAVPSVNLEWIRKISRDSTQRGYSKEDVRRSILRRMPDYVNYITPQFARTHINFQTIPTIDTSDPFNHPESPTLHESYVVIHFQDKITLPNFPHLLRTIPDSFMSRRRTLVIPGTQILLAVEEILLPLISEMVKKSREIRGIEEKTNNTEAGLIGML